MVTVTSLLALTRRRGSSVYCQVVSAAAEDSRPSGLPSFAEPPVTEVVLGAAFTPLPMRAVDLGPLAERWRPEYPVIQEQPPLEPSDEPFGLALPRLRLGLPMMRHWWISGDQARLLQLQQDRFYYNWRRIPGLANPYPRYAYVREEFEKHYSEFVEFAETRFGIRPDVTQGEMTYINDVGGSGDEGSPLATAVTRCWAAVPGHHLGEPDEVQFTSVYPAPVEGGTARLYMSLAPTRRPDGTASANLTLTVRGTPAGRDAVAALAFLDSARSHIVRSFSELTTEPMHRRWGG